MPTANGITAFYSEASPLSNHNKHSLKHPDGTFYVSPEHGYSHRCSLYLQDDITAHKILTAITPNNAKTEAKNIKGLKDGNWHTYHPNLAREQMYHICKLKMEQTPNLKNFLLATGNTTLVEASKYGTKWGAGIAINDPDVFKKHRWKGELVRRNLDENP